jgi:RHS repeat-associated protein
MGGTYYTWNPTTQTHHGIPVQHNGSGYRCKSDPYGPHCNTREPGVTPGWDEGWILEGACAIGPGSLVDFSKPLLDATLYTSGGTAEFRLDNLGNAVTIENIPGVGRMIGGELEFYIKDYLGSYRTSVNHEGARVGRTIEYFPFGRQEVVQVSNPTSQTETFTGKELDEFDPEWDGDGEGLYHFGARYYDPDVSVWISPDPLRQYSSPYTYCGNNPISCIDPDGMAGVHASGSGGITWNGERYGGAYTLSFNHNSGKSIFNPSSYSVGLLKTVNLDGGIPSSNGAGTAWGLSVGLSNSDAASQVTGGGRTTGFSSMGASFLGKWLSGGLGFDMSDSYSDNNFSIPTENAKGAPVRMLDLSLRLPGKTFGAETHDQVKTDTKLIWQLGGDN